MRRFAEFVAIDWSGQAIARPKGLALAIAGPESDGPTLLVPGGGWSRQAIGDWLLAQADLKRDLLIGLDLSPGFPFADAGAYFPGWPNTPPDAKALWALIDRMSSADPHLGAGGFLCQPEVARYFRQHGGRLGDRFGGRGGGRLRVCEATLLAQGLSPSSCLNLVGAAQVGKSSLTGMRVLHRLGGRVPVWPFDPVPDQGPLIVEIYTTIAARAAGLRAGRSKVRDAASLAHALAALGCDGPARLDSYDDHSTDAILTAAWLRTAAARVDLWSPTGLTPAIARTEGWTFGVT